MIADQNKHSSHLIIENLEHSSIGISDKYLKLYAPENNQLNNRDILLLKEFEIKTQENTNAISKKDNTLPIKK